jgi:hypothetical protein
MARIVIVRSNEYINRFRSIDLYLNGEILGYIDNGETIEYDLPGGDHKLVAKIDWCGSQQIDFNLEEHESQIFNLSGFKHSRVIMPFSFTLVLLHLVTNVFFGIQLSIFFILPLLLLLIFYISVGRNQYLSLETSDCSNELSAERIK